MSHCDIVTKEHDFMTYAPTTVGPNVTQLTLHARTQNSSTFKLRLFPQEKEHIICGSGDQKWLKDLGSKVWETAMAWFKPLQWSLGL